MGGEVPLGYDLGQREMIVNPDEAGQVREIFRQYLRLGSVLVLAEYLRAAGIWSKQWTSQKGVVSGGVVFSRGSLYYLLASPIYLGKIIHKDKVHDGLHEAIVDQETWDATRAMMKSHEPNRNGPRSSDPQRFLRDLLFFADGRRLSPTHATKGPRRYSYYFAEADTTRGAQAVRLPAVELERTVVSAVRELLDNPLGLSEHVSSLSIRDTQHLLAPAKAKELWLKDLATSAARVLARSMLGRITVMDGELSIKIEADSLVNVTQRVPREPITLTVPFEIRRRGREVRLVITGTPSEAEPISSVIRAVAMARGWAERIASVRSSNSTN